jgi:hypothetical protein
MRKIQLILVICIIFLAGCSHIHYFPGFSIAAPPGTYIETDDPEWKVVKLKAGLSYDKAWDLLVGHMKNKYPVAKADKESGRVQTEWIEDPDYTWGYKVRISVKLVKDKGQAQIQTDAIYNKVTKGDLSGTIYKDYGWIPGSDQKTLDEVHADLSALLGG